jgi:hypothetical protein
VLTRKVLGRFQALQRVYAECKETEQKIVVAERVRSGGLTQTEELIMDAVCPMNLTNAPREPFAQSFEDSKAPVRNFVCISERLHQLGHVLTNARDRQYSEEHTLHRIAEDAFIAAGFLAMETRVEEVKLLRRIPKNLLDDDLEGKCSGYGGQSPDYYAGQSPEYVPQPPRYVPRSPGYVQSPKAADPPKAAPKDIQTELQDILKEHLASQVEYVWNRLIDSERRLREARSGPLSDAGSMDSDARGAARVRKMIKLTREVRGNEIDYASVERNAMKRGAISDSGRWENFEDHASDGYSAATIEEQGWPMREKREKRIDKWIDDVSNNVELHAAEVAKNTPEQSLTDQANWRSAGQDVAIDPEEQRWENGVASFAFGEDVEVWEDREGIRRLIDQMIA